MKIFIIVSDPCTVFLIFTGRFSQRHIEDLNNAITSELNLVDTDSLISLLLPITHPLVSFADL